mmetsp:Transcript_48546/g.149988  ORF Transcript_48546/g.149988 Transcript_48546/m.149988 type:complete len:257 (-) Transcript_48546:497-1267(-)
MLCWASAGARGVRQVLDLECPVFPHLLCLVDGPKGRAAALGLAAGRGVLGRLAGTLGQEAALLQQPPAMPQGCRVIMLAQSHISKLGQGSVLQEARLALGEVAGLVPGAAPGRGAGGLAAALAGGVGGGHGRRLGQGPLRQRKDVAEAHRRVREGAIAAGDSVAHGGLTPGALALGRAALLLVPRGGAPADGRAARGREEPPSARAAALDAPGELPCAALQLRAARSAPGGHAAPRGSGAGCAGTCTCGVRVASLR